MHRTPRTIAGLVATAVLSAGLVTVSAPSATAASVRCDNAVRSYRIADARFDNAQQQIDAINHRIKAIDRQRRTLGDSPRDRNIDRQLQSLRRQAVGERESLRVVRAQQKTKRSQAAVLIEKFC